MPKREWPQLISDFIENGLHYDGSFDAIFSQNHVINHFKTIRSVRQAR
jgi:hypothetical protein